MLAVPSAQHSDGATMRHRGIAIAAGLLIAACLAAGGAAAGQPLTIKQGWVTLANVLEVIAFDKPDILPHYGKSYVVTQTRFAGTSPELTAFATGEVDICTMAYSSFGAAVLNAHLDDMRIIADGFEDGYDDYLSTAYLVRNDGGIKTIADLKGKVFATNVAGRASISAPARS